jgi:hypothetical protein
MLLPSLAVCEDSRPGGELRARLRVSSEGLARNAEYGEAIATQKGHRTPRSIQLDSQGPGPGATASSLRGGTKNGTFMATTPRRSRPRPPPPVGHQRQQGAPGPGPGRRGGDAQQSAQLVKAMAREAAMKTEVCQLRKALLSARCEAAVAAVSARNATLAAEVRSETMRLRGVHLSGVVKDVRPATQDEVASVATAMMEHLERVEVEPSKRGWFKLFKQFDENGDGHISYAELLQMIRGQMKMPPSLMPERRIQAVWHYMDLDGNGWIDMGEFGRFFRQAERGGAAKRPNAQKSTSLANHHATDLTDGTSGTMAERLQEAPDEKFREPTLAETMLARTKESTSLLAIEKQKLELELAISRGGSGGAAWGFGGAEMAAGGSDGTRGIEASGRGAHARSLLGLGDSLPPLRSPRTIV